MHLECDTCATVIGQEGDRCARSACCGTIQLQTKIEGELRCSHCNELGSIGNGARPGHHTDHVRWEGVICPGYWVFVKRTAATNDAPKPPDPRKLRDSGAIEDCLRQRRTLAEVIQAMVQSSTDLGRFDRAAGAIQDLREAETVIAVLEWVLQERETIGR